MHNFIRWFKLLYGQGQLVHTLSHVNICCITPSINPEPTYFVMNVSFYDRDQGVSFPIQRGLQASRSRIVYFRHNDIEHLRSLLEQQALADRKVYNYNDC